MTDKLTRLLTNIEEIVGKATPGPWGKAFNSSIVIRTGDLDHIDRTGRGNVASGVDPLDLKAIVLMRSVILPLVEVVKAAISGGYDQETHETDVDKALSKLAEVDCP